MGNSLVISDNKNMLSLCQSSLSLTPYYIHSHLIISSPFRKDLGSLNQNLYLSPYIIIYNYLSYLETLLTYGTEAAALRLTGDMQACDPIVETHCLDKGRIYSPMD
jgi:hypothetical protein